MKRWMLAAALLIAATAAAQPRTTESQARTYIWSALITGAAATIVSPAVEIAPQLREKLALPEAAERAEVYEAIHGLMRGRLVRVRPATAAEVAPLAERQGAHPVFAVEGGGAPLLVAYDLQRDQVSLLALLGSPWTAAAPEPAPAPPPTPIVQPEPIKTVRVDERRASPEMPRGHPSPPFLLKPVFFAYRDASLNEEAVARFEDAGLPKIALTDGVQFVVRGHSDRLEADEYKQKLSEQRAEAVRDYLAGHGVPAENIRLHGFGASVSMTACAQRERTVLISCLAPDRRVTVEVISAPR